MFHLTVTKNYQDLSNQTAQYLADYVENNPKAVLCCSTGGTPTGMYEELAKIVETKHINCSEVTVIKFDEWVGLDATNPSTCEYYLQKYVIQPLKIPVKHYIHFDNSTTDPEKECERINLLLQDIIIDIFVLGLGTNGHLGFNEPGSDPRLHAHIVQLTEDTLSHPMLSGNTKPVTKGMTLGIQDILDAKTALLLVNGAHKQKQFARLMTKEISSDFPASYLWQHPQVECFVDRVATE